LGDRFYATVRALSLPALKGWIRLRVSGLEHLPTDGPLLVVANHFSYLDPAVLGRACPRKLHFMIKRAVYRATGLQWFFRGMDSIPVAVDESDSTSLRAALRLLSQGKAIGIFPEGGRRTDGRLGPAKIGAALLAARSGCQVQPVGINGAFRSMPPGASWPRPGRVAVRFGRPFMVQRARGKQAREQLDEVAARMMAEIGGLLDDGGPGGDGG
jgi:1-acyl-sn-glycerol-3-phosphate acyltransferase